MFNQVSELIMSHKFNTNEAQEDIFKLFLFQVHPLCTEKKEL